MNVNLWPHVAPSPDGPNAGCPYLAPYLLDGAGPHPAIVVLPGGGYARRAEHEGEPIARWLNQLGISALVLHYRVAPFQHPVPLEDARRAVRLARHRAAAWRLDPRRVGALGFSAGGHLAATLGTHYDRGDPAADDPVERASCRPDLLVLCYPVITMGPQGHGGSRLSLLGDRQADAELVALLSNEAQVTPDTPPAFLWHTVDDASVPVENSLLFAAALRRHAVPFELHAFEQGQHGLGLAEGFPGAEMWPALCAAWLRRWGFGGAPGVSDGR